MENCAFIDIFTTQNDLYGKNNCPIQFCCELFTNDEIYDDAKFFSPERRKMFNIIPDEEILTQGYLNSGHRNEDVRTSDYNGIELKNALEKVYKLLSLFRDKKMYVIGYNHVSYDLDILNRNFKRVLNLEPIVFQEDRILDVMKLSEIRIPVNKIGNYTMESVLTYLTGDCSKVQNLRLNKSTATDIRITKMILRSLVETGSKLSDIVSEINSEREVKIMNFGKYKGAELEFIFENDIQYCGWLTKNKDIARNNPNLVNTLSKMMSTKIV